VPRDVFSFNGKKGWGGAEYLKTKISIRRRIISGYFRVRVEDFQNVFIGRLRGKRESATGS